jgi:type III pantothenate kinase
MNPLIAVDIGNSRVKLGWYERVVAGTYTEPVATLQLAIDPWEPRSLGAWFDRLAAKPTEEPRTWLIASVHHRTAGHVVAWAHHSDPEARVAELVFDDLPLNVALASPGHVGMDRLLAAVAANRLRSAARPAIVVDVGSAITVDVISERGDFLGGAILPGIAMSARALAEQTDRLPRVPIDQLDDPPPALGTSTESAIQSGLFWGAIGALRELVGRLSADLPTMPQIFLTGGAAPAVTDLLGEETRYVAHMVLGGIALTHASIHR